MAKKRTAIVVVSKQWFDSSRVLLSGSPPSESTGDSHVIIGPLDDANDERGLWLKDIITTGILKKDAEDDTSPVTVERLMIPWAFVLALGLVEQEAHKIAGFRTDQPLSVLNAAAGDV
jgi:hypothetical protein